MDDKQPTDNRRKKETGNRIGRLDVHTVSYYKKVQETLNDTHESEQDRELLVGNAVRQLCSEAIPVSQNQMVSKIIEQLVQEASDNANLVDQLMQAFGADWELACTDRFASHVTQTLLICAAPHMADKLQDALATSIKDRFLTLYRVLMGNLAMFMQHTYASHILRVLIEILAATRVADNVIKSKLARKYQQDTNNNKETDPWAPLKAAVPSEFPSLLDEISTKMLALGKLSDHAENYLSNPVLQTVLLVSQSRGKDATAHACQALIDNTDMFTINTDTQQAASSDNMLALPDMTTHAIGSWLVQQVLAVAPDNIYEGLLQGELLPLLRPMALHPIANFVLQTLIAQTRTQAQFEQVFGKLKGRVEDALAHGHTGVLQEMARGCAKHASKQENMLKCLQKAFHCYKPAERQCKLFPLLASLTTYEVFYKVTDSTETEDVADSDTDSKKETEAPVLTSIHLAGSLLAQILLSYDQPRPFITSMLELSGPEVTLLACDPCGSRILDALVNSKGFGEKTLGRLLNKLKGYCVSICCDKFGSRSLETLWKHANLPQRVTMATELAASGDQVRSHRFGRFLWYSASLGQFQMRRGQWEAMQSSNTRKRNLLQDIVHTPAAADKTTGVPLEKKRKLASGEDDIDRKSQIKDRKAEPESPLSASGQKKSRKKKLKKNVTN